MVQAYWVWTVEGKPPDGVRQALSLAAPVGGCAQLGTARLSRVLGTGAVSGA